MKIVGDAVFLCLLAGFMVYAAWTTLATGLPLDSSGLLGVHGEPGSGGSAALLLGLFGLWASAQWGCAGMLCGNGAVQEWRYAGMERRGPKIVPPDKRKKARVGNINVSSSGNRNQSSQQRQLHSDDGILLVNVVGRDRGGEKERGRKSKEGREGG